MSAAAPGPSAKELMREAQEFQVAAMVAAQNRGWMRQQWKVAKPAAKAYCSSEEVVSKYPHITRITLLEYKKVCVQACRAPLLLSNVCMRAVWFNCGWPVVHIQCR